MWSQSREASSPEGIESFRQISWYTPLVQASYKQLLSDAQSEDSRDRLLAVAWNEPGAWLNAIPVSPLGITMENKGLRNAVEIRIGALLVQLHICCHCGEQVDVKVTHSLSCRRNSRRMQWSRKAWTCKDPILT